MKARKANEEEQHHQATIFRLSLCTFSPNVACEQGVPPAAPAQTAVSAKRTIVRLLLRSDAPIGPPTAPPPPSQRTALSYTDRHTFLRPLALRSKTVPTRNLARPNSKIGSIGGHGVDLPSGHLFVPEKAIKAIYVSVRATVVSGKTWAYKAFWSGRDHDRPESCTLGCVVLFRYRGRP
jgi:hypothetical protein